jgi:uncharacterized repeat protein (TIGR01451 family)
MRTRAVLATASIAIGAAVLGVFATPAGAHQNPSSCSSNSLVLTLTKDRTLVRNGDTSTYTVSVANDAGSACDLTSVTLTLALPAPNGTPTGQSVTLASNADYPAGMANQVLGTVPYTVALNPGVSDAVAEARASGVLHDAPTDHAAQITKTLGTTVTQPHLTLTQTATPTSGQAPLGVTYDYTLTNTSTTAAPVAGPTVTDERCTPAIYTGGDTNGNGVLEVGETWTYTCTTAFGTAGVFTSTASATGTSTVDSRPVTSVPVASTVTVTAPAGTPTETGATGTEESTPTNAELLRQSLPSVNSRQARPNAPCVTLASRVTVRARELTLVRVVVQDNGERIGRALVRLTGPGFVRRRLTNANGVATFRVRAERSGRLVIQSNRCLGADRVRVRGARRVSGPAVPRLTG